MLLFVPELVAQTKSDWGDVQRLKPKSEIRVVLWDGQNLVGRFESADVSVLKMAVFPDPSVRLGSLREFKREQIHGVFKTHLSPPDPDRYAGTGMVVGGATGAAVVGARMGRAWPLGVILGGCAGAALGVMVGTTAGIGVTIKNHRDKLIYESTTRPADAQ